MDDKVKLEAQWSAADALLSKVKLLAEWYAADELLAKAKAEELRLRNLVGGLFFTNPVEGTNSADVNDGTGAVVKLKQPINRKVLPEELAKLERAIGTNNRRSVIVSECIKYKPELVLSAYRELTEDERTWFDAALEIKEGTFALEVVIPKRRK
jgi:hypothetical protein